MNHPGMIANCNIKNSISIHQLKVINLDFFLLKKKIG